MSIACPCESSTPHPAARRSGRLVSEPELEADGSVLRLVYDGDDYQGEMNAAELAGVIRSVNDLAQAITGSGDLAGMSRPRIRVRPFQEGSFGWDTVIELLGPGGLIVGGGGLVGASFRFYWKNMRRVVASHTYHPDRETHEVILINGEVMEWTEQEWQLYNNRRAKRAARGIAAPLRNGASLRIEAGQRSDVVPAADAHLFEPPEEPNTWTDHFDTWATPDTVSFDPSRKWRLTSRDVGAFSAAIQDRQFLENVALGRVRIGKNDGFKLGMRTVTTEDDDGVQKRQWFVERVIEHRQGEEQDALIDADTSTES